MNRKWTKKNSTQENWSKEETQKYLHEKAKKESNKNADKMKGKKLRLVKVSDHPPTFKEIEIK